MSQLSARVYKHRLRGISTGLAIWLGVAGLLVSVPIMTSSSVVQAQTVPAAVQEAFTLLRQGRVQDAIALFEQARRQYPQLLEAKLGLAIAYRRQGLIPQAWQAYQDVLAQDPNNELALRAVGLLGSYRSEWQVSGIEALTTLLNLKPNDAEARGLRTAPSCTARSGVGPGC